MAAMGSLSRAGRWSRSVFIAVHIPQIGRGGRLLNRVHGALGERGRGRRRGRSAGLRESAQVERDQRCEVPTTAGNPFQSEWSEEERNRLVGAGSDQVSLRSVHPRPRQAVERVTMLFPSWCAVSLRSTFLVSVPFAIAACGPAGPAALTPDVVAGIRSTRVTSYIPQERLTVQEKNSNGLFLPAEIGIFVNAMTARRAG
jgi:hypothetical protein